MKILSAARLRQIFKATLVTNLAVAFVGKLVQTLTNSLEPMTTYNLRSFVVLLATGLFFTLPPAHAVVKLHPLFTEHMVLQRGINTPIWGTADPHEKVSVTLGQNKVEATAGADGKWMVKIPELLASTKPEVLIVKGTNELRVADVLIGDVWIGSGQSNMNFRVINSTQAKRVTEASKSGKYKNIRLFHVAAKATDAPQTTVSNQWRLAIGADLDRFSAVLFYFAESLQGSISDVPMGLINSSVSGTNAYSWIPNSVYENDPATQYVRDWYQKELGAYGTRKFEYDRKLDEYKAQVADLKSKKQPIPKDLHGPEEPMGSANLKRPCGLYNAMIAPLQPAAIRGVVWYQGESDAVIPLPKAYYGTMKSLVESWRTDWAKADKSSTLTSYDFPFYFVQLPNYDAGQYCDWPQIREAQLRLSHDLTNSGLAVTLDAGDSKNIHPPDKTIVGVRMAKVALARAYEMNVPYAGPTYKSFRIDGNKIYTFFDIGHDKMKPLYGSALANFTIGDDSHTFVPATATIEGRYVIVTSPNVAAPVAVRYAWENDPKGINFGNTALIPASPFRTDNFPLEAK